MHGKSFKQTLAACFLFAAGTASALPIGFGRNQGDIHYNELNTENFSLYHDARTPTEARMMIKALEAARPHMEQWFKARRKKPLPVIMSAVTNGASFANFITDAIELQTMGLGDRDLAWHEYTHSTMYRHLDNWIGPAGSVIHLPWMPAWWIEGLAEAMSQSTGSEIQASIERWHALTGFWPSYDKLHSLYGSEFSTEGYATSGAFVTYLLRTYDADKLPQVLNDFYRYSMPWWWPWAAVPFFNDFMPMDEALRNWTGKSGKELYNEYKLAATSFWKSRDNGAFLQQTFASGARFSSTNGIQIRGNDVFHVINADYEIKEIQLRFDEKDPHWAAGWDDKKVFPKDNALTARVINPDYSILVTQYLPDNMETRFVLWYQPAQKDAPLKKLSDRSAFISKLFQTEKDIIWFEELREQNQLCAIAKSDLKQNDPKVRCSLKTRAPERLAYIGMEGDGNRAKALWFRHSVETLVGNRYQMWRVDPTQFTVSKFNLTDNSRPISFAKVDDQNWVLMNDYRSRFLRLIDAQGQCQEERVLADMATQMHALPDGQILFSLFRGARDVLYRSKPQELPQRACTTNMDHRSPLIAAMQEKQRIPLTIAMQASSTWDSQPLQDAPKVEQVRKAPSLDKQPSQEKILSERPARWRGRPLFAFPWIGADAGGTQLGFISVPLMDYMQNETVRVNYLYGVNSRFPQTEVVLISNRWLTTWSASVFRMQTYNGAIGTDLLYYDERGGQITASRYLPTLNLTFDAGWKSSTLKPIIGPPNFIRTGHQNEFTLSLSHRFSVGRFTFDHYLMGSALPEFANKTWEYDKLGAGSTVSFPIDFFSWRTTSMSLGLNASRTRGPNMKVLREVYRPLRTFVPGTGGGFNEINVGLIGPGYLTSAQYGDTQARAKFSWVFPLVHDLEKLIGIVYFQRLDFSMFYNYGGAWNGDELPSPDRLIQAHGYNLDLQTDIKGITVNAGLGTGQVVGQEFEVFFLFGFDALIN